MPGSVISSQKYMQYYNNKSNIKMQFTSNCKNITDPVYIRKLDGIDIRMSSSLCAIMCLDKALRSASHFARHINTTTIIAKTDRRGRRFVERKNPFKMPGNRMCKAIP